MAMGPHDRYQNKEEDINTVRSIITEGIGCLEKAHNYTQSN